MNQDFLIATMAITLANPNFEIQHITRGSLVDIGEVMEFRAFNEVGQAIIGYIDLRNNNKITVVKYH